MRLDEDEEIVLELRPHGVVLLRPALAVPVLAGLGAFGAAALPAGGYRSYGQLAILAIVLLMLVRLAIAPWLRWLGTRVVLTTERIVLRSGVLVRHRRDIALEAVYDVAYSRTLLQRPLRRGTLVVQCAGERGEVVLRNLPDVAVVHRELYQLVELRRKCRHEAEHELSG